jgi:hypothetical protein
VFPLPSAEVDRNGLLQAAWNDCRLRAGCAGNDIVLASSADGVNWSTPARVPLAPGTATSYILPGLAANPGARGPALSLLFYSYPTRCAPVSCRLSVGLATRAASGSWSAPRRLDATAMRVTWLADTQTGRFVGDYVANSFVASGKTVSFFPVASPPRNGRFREGLFAYRS